MPLIALIQRMVPVLPIVVALGCDAASGQDTGPIPMPPIPIPEQLPRTEPDIVSQYTLGAIAFQNGPAAVGEWEVEVRLERDFTLDRICIRKNENSWCAGRGVYNGSAVFDASVIYTVIHCRSDVETIEIETDCKILVYIATRWKREGRHPDTVAHVEFTFANGHFAAREIPRSWGEP